MINTVIMIFLGLAISVRCATAESFDHEQVRALRQQGVIVPLATLIQDAQQRYRDGYIVEAKLQLNALNQWLYEIEFIDADGTLRELYYDAYSGELIAYEVYIIDDQGQLRSMEYDARSGKPLSNELHD